MSFTMEVNWILSDVKWSVKWWWIFFRNVYQKPQYIQIVLRMELTVYWASLHEILEVSQSNCKQTTHCINEEIFLDSFEPEHWMLIAYVI